ncbi:hypothetical protein PUNSTDRAFT_125809 [Punctularia strigosozonata HHB-11173 SS5]|uniref:uncharacterized protein n=1 Tax=Punctularia strigosozonata (strain HHB-11173) TaxID=741275 RepID=UPI0004416667|nr:uncharacterized protein PUNSTDRAFT_125809 [Punctularia strigosozonata HHB-11173 SS5]EIN09708.1 hypothetical protein PUNSTDRAFT_125809 [Punctularia strigosozonata HHB-11173 SS5]
MANAVDLERDIFGGSDSELSSEEDDVPQQRLRVSPPRRAAIDEEESSAESGSGDDYAGEKRPASQAKRPRKQRRQRGEEGDSRPRERKRKRRPQTVEDLSELPPEQAKKLQLDMQIEAILKPKKAARKTKKKKGADEEVLDRFADEEVSRLREAMLAAADDDEQANKEKLPATSKLRLLPQVMDVLRKSSLEQSIIDNNLLEGVRRWLEPLPDKSLPALNIQQQFFRELPTMKFIDASVLKESGLGRIVLFYTKCRRVTPDVQRTAHALVAAWSRPIIKRSASYRDRVVPMAESSGGAGGERLGKILERAKESEKGRVRKNAVSIPQRELGTYTVAPQSSVMSAGKANVEASVRMDNERRMKNAERLRSLTRKMNLKG